jgi:hypothetical protein
MPPNAPVPGDGAAAASRCFWMTAQPRVVTSLRYPEGIMAEKVFEAHWAARPADVDEELASLGPR